MKSIWKGAISFGLVNIPVRLYSATERETVAFHMLSKKDHSRIRFLRVSEANGKEVPYEDIVKGYELEDGGYVVVSDEELAEASPEKSSTIEIQEFVDESEISSLYFDKPYYLEPDKSAGKAYALLRDALSKSRKVGISQFVLRNREHLCALKAMDEVLVLNALRFASEIRETAELSVPKSEKITQSEINLALKLIEGLTARFDPKKYKDTYAEEVKKVIDAKAKGQKIKAPAKTAPSTKVIDLTAALKESLKTPKKKRVA
jgi:DNA end-binding protein Ku